MPESNKSEPLARIQDNELAEAVMRRIDELPDTLDVTIPESVGALKALLIDQENVLARATVKQGFCFIALKEQLKHGEFESWLSEHGFNVRTVQEKMRAANFLLNAPEKSRAKLVGLGQKKLSVLASADATLLDEVINHQQEFDELVSGSYVELRQKLRQLESKNADLNTRVDTEETKVKDLQSRLQKRSASSDYPEFVDVTRHESVALADYISIRLDDLERLGTELLNIISTTDNTPEFKTFCDIAGASLFTNVRMIEARSARLLTLLGEALPESATAGTDISQIMLIGEEVEQAIRDRADMVQDHEREKFERENARQMRKPRKAGRPKAQK